MIHPGTSPLNLNNQWHELNLKLLDMALSYIQSNKRDAAATLIRQFVEQEHTRLSERRLLGVNVPSPYVRRQIVLKQMLREAILAQTNTPTQTLARFCADVSTYVGQCVYSSPVAQEIERRHNGMFRRAQDGTWLFLSRSVLSPLERQCLESDLATLDRWMEEQ